MKNDVLTILSNCYFTAKDDNNIHADIFNKNVHNNYILNLSINEENYNDFLMRDFLRKNEHEIDIYIEKFSVNMNLRRGALNSQYNYFLQRDIDIEKYNIKNFLLKNNYNKIKFTSSKKIVISEQLVNLFIIFENCIDVKRQIVEAIEIEDNCHNVINHIIEQMNTNDDVMLKKLFDTFSCVTSIRNKRQDKNLFKDFVNKLLAFYYVEKNRKQEYENKEIILETMDDYF